MSKSVLVIDTPKKCTDCTFCEHLDEGWLHCSLKDKTARAFDKPDWCPLTPLPPYKPSTQYMQRGDTKSTTHMVQYVYDSGWNDCRAEILKGEIINAE